MEELGGECTSHPLLLTVYRLTGVPNTGGSAIVYTRGSGGSGERVGKFTPHVREDEGSN